MAKGVNRVFLLGHVGKDPEIRSTQGGTMVAGFSLATPDREKDAQGNWIDKPEWHNLVSFGRTAEIVRDYVKKGTQLFIDGRLQTRSWDDRESGQKKYRTEIIVNELTVLGGRRENGSSGYNGGRGYSGSNASDFGQPLSTSGDDYGDEGITDQDIPF